MQRSSYIQKKLVDSFRGSLHPDDLVTSRNVIKFGSGNPQLATELVILGIKGSYYGLEVDEILPFIILDTTEFQVIVGWRDIARRDALFVLLHQMKMDAQVEIASEGGKESLSYMKAHLAHLAQRQEPQVEVDVDNDLPDLVVAEEPVEHRVPANPPGEPEIPPNLPVGEHVHEVTAEELLQLRGRWQRIVAGENLVDGEQREPIDVAQLFMMRKEDEEPPIPKRRRADQSVMQQTEPVLMFSVERVPDMFFAPFNVDSFYYRQYEHFRTVKGHKMLKWPRMSDPIESEGMGLHAFIELLRLDPNDYESFNLFIELYHTFLWVSDETPQEAVPHGGIPGLNIVQQQSGRWLWRVRHDARNGMTCYKYMAYWWDYMYHAYAAAYMQVMYSSYHILPNLQTLQGWVSIPENSHYRESMLRNPPYVNEAPLVIGYAFFATSKT